MTTESMILAEAHRLPESLKQEVLRFIVFLQQNQQAPPLQATPKKVRVFGRSKGRYTLAPNFDAPLEDFSDYM